ncbi:peptidase A4 family-domain-containing protein [Coniella lustricola]|uniref:Peptidase A4 family-domain-containing protein n=1 Tax=Coniella lustricola TaxID=2025994 RepID=A0A2T3A4J2_9PEZI|nr:peptidase A4 family-domain-containing protein [Coniella lustricola]
MSLSSILQLLLLLGCSGSARAEGQLRTSSVSPRARAAALRDEHFSKLGQATDAKVSESLLSMPSIKARDLIPSEPGTSYHWAGAVVPPPSGENITTVTATMTLPDLVAPEDVRQGPGGEYFLYVWVGIDGLDSVDPGDCTALWQTGFAGQIKNGVTTWWGWVCYLWDQDENAVFDTYILDAESGDTVNMTVQSLSSSEGIFWLDNLSTGSSTSYSVTGGDICMQQAEWIVEDPWDGSTEDILYMLVWPDYGSMVFDNAVAYTNAGSTVAPNAAGSTLYVVESYYDNDIIQNNVSATDSTVTVDWLASGPGTKLGARLLV